MMIIQHLSWFLFGLSLSVVNVASIDRTITRILVHKTTRKYWISYLYRLVLTGLGLMIAFQAGTSQMIFMFLGILLFRWTVLLPDFLQFYLHVLRNS
jgi:hypothetical protein